MAANVITYELPKGSMLTNCPSLTFEDKCPSQFHVFLTVFKRIFSIVKTLAPGDQEENIW